MVDKARIEDDIRREAAVKNTSKHYHKNNSRENAEKKLENLHIRKFSSILSRVPANVPREFACLHLITKLHTTILFMNNETQTRGLS